MNRICRYCAILSLAVAGVLAGCWTSSPEIPFGYVENWVIRQNAVPPYFAEYDVLYVWPYISRSGERDSDLDTDKARASFQRDLTDYMTVDAFGNKARVFSPIIHRMNPALYDIYEAEELADWSGTEACPSVEEVVDAVKYYLKTYHPAKRPYVIIGHGQGSMMVYEALKKLRRHVTPQDGCVAVYLPNLPPALIARIPKDFGGWMHPLRPARSRYDTGVIAAWREVTESESAGIATNRTAELEFGFLNPLTWSARRPAPASLCAEARYYDAVTTNVLERRQSIPGFCSATPLGTNGLLRVVSAVRPEVPLSGDCVSLFTGNIVLNVRDRVYRYRMKLRWDGWDTETTELPYKDEEEPGKDGE